MKVLAVDDDAMTLKIIGMLLAEWGFEHQTVDNAEKALEILDDPAARPQIVLLDWVMPGMEGIDLCRKIKASKEYGFIYTILLTGKRASKDIVEGLDAGADDYVVKSTGREELKSRLNVGVRIVKYEQELKKYGRDMEKLAEERARQLIQSERLSLLGELSAGIAHEIRNFLSPVMGYAEILELQMPKLEKAATPELCRACEGYIKKITMGAQKINDLMETVRAHSRKKGDEKTWAKINETTDHAIELCSRLLKQHKLEKRHSRKTGMVMICRQEIEQALVNILKNAAEALEGRKDGVISVETFQEGGFACVRVEDNGPGVPDEVMERIWEPFYTTKKDETASGLGLCICKSIVEEHGGDVLISTKPGGGAQLLVRLPSKTQE